MVIVGGTFEVAAGRQEEFLAERLEQMRTSRAETGCLEYTMGADPLDAGRVVLFERWASQEDLDAHLAGMAGRPSSDPAAVAPLSASIVIYDVAGERRLVG